MNKKNSGFTLIELSIVIVIIGLIVAGIIGGQSLVRQAKIKSMMNQISNFKTAINSFKLKYDALPGDITNAFDYWGTNCSDDAVQCNGDGNGKIVFSSSLLSNEALRAWQHLSLSKLLNNSYSGTTTKIGNTLQCNIGVSNPKSSIAGIGHKFTYNANLIKNSSFILTGSGSTCSNGFLETKEMLNIDQKYDDGLSRSGRIIAIGKKNKCFNTNSLKYILSSNEKSCGFISDIAF